MYHVELAAHDLPPRWRIPARTVELPAADVEDAARQVIRWAHSDAGAPPWRPLVRASLAFASARPVDGRAVNRAGGSERQARSHERAPRWRSCVAVRPSDYLPSCVLHVRRRQLDGPRRNTPARRQIVSRQLDVVHRERLWAARHSPTAGMSTSARPSPGGSLSPPPGSSPLGPAREAALRRRRG